MLRAIISIENDQKLLHEVETRQQIHQYQERRMDIGVKKMVDRMHRDHRKILIKKL